MLKAIVGSSIKGGSTEGNGTKGGSGFTLKYAYPSNKAIFGAEQRVLSDGQYSGPKFLGPVSQPYSKHIFSRINRNIKITLTIFLFFFLFLGLTFFLSFFLFFNCIF
jgi:hypothetical protein